MMIKVTGFQKKLHQQALEQAYLYKKAEGELLEILTQVDQAKVYLAFGYGSLFSYITQNLGLSENVAYNLSTVLRKSYQIPLLKAEVLNGTLSLSKARKITPVLSPENSDEENARWINKAKELSQRQLEKEVARVRPELLAPEKIRYIQEERLKLELGVSEQLMTKLRRVQDLVCQKKCKSVSLEESLEEMTNFYLDKKDPIQKEVSSKKQMVKTEKQKSEVNITKINSEILPKLQTMSSRRPVLRQVKVKKPKYLRIKISSKLRHKVYLKYKGQCAYRSIGPVVGLVSGLANGQKRESSEHRCTQRRWLDVHHLKPVHSGGDNSLDNLILLCRAHHRYAHDFFKS